MYALAAPHTTPSQQKQYLPRNRGFDTFYGIYTGGGSHTKHVSVSQPFKARTQDTPMIFQGVNLWDNGEVSADNYGAVHSTELYTKRALQALSDLQTTQSPFFLYLSYQAIHDPLEVGDEKFITDTKCSHLTDNRQMLCGMMAEIDDGVGQIYDYLQSAEMWDNMVFFYASDNGGVLDHGSSNSPYHGEKGMYWEGGVHVPAFVAGGFLKASLDVSYALHNVSVPPRTALPSCIRSSIPCSHACGGCVLPVFRLCGSPTTTTTQQQDGIKFEERELTSYTHITDLHTTILSLSGYDWSADDYALDGMSFWGAITNKVVPEEKLRNEVLINANSLLFAESGAIIVGKYKYIENPDPKESHIYGVVRLNLAEMEIDGMTSKDELAKTISQTAFDILPGMSYLFNLELNPSEQNADDCEALEECSNLANHDDYQDLLSDMKAALARYRDNAKESTFTWEDDGILANPVMFNSVWAPWRDDGGHPYASYLGLHQRETTDSLNTHSTTMKVDSNAKSSSPSSVSMLSAKSFLSITSDTMLIAFAAIMGFALILATISFFIRRQYRKVGFASQGDGVSYTPL